MSDSFYRELAEWATRIERTLLAIQRQQDKIINILEGKQNPITKMMENEINKAAGRPEE